MAQTIELYRVDEAAKELNISPWTVRDWIASRKLASVKLGRLVRVPRSEIDRLIEQGTTPAQDA